MWNGGLQKQTEGVKGDNNVGGEDNQDSVEWLCRVRSGGIGRGVENESESDRRGGS